MKRFFAAALLVLLSVPALFAGKYIIDSYDFFFEGNTNIERVYEYLGLEDGASFDTFEALSSHVKSKAQSLVDARIFTSVDYDVLESDVVNSMETAKANVLETAQNESNDEEQESVEYHYIAVYKVNDKSPFFIFPTPKYDSNYGAKIGIRVDSKNFGGKLAKFQINADMKQNDHSFEKAEYSLDFNILGYPLAGFDVDASLSFGYNGEEGGLAGTSMGLSTKFMGIDIASFKMDAAASLEFNGIESLENSVLALSTSLYDIKFGDDVKFKFSTGVKFNLDEDDVASFGFKTFNYSASLSDILNGLGGFSISHGLTFYPRKDAVNGIPKGQIKTTNSLSYHGLYLKNHKVSLSFGVDTTTIKGAEDIAITASESISVPFSLPWKFSFTPSLKLYRVYHTNGSKKMTEWSVDKRIVVGATLERSSISYDLDGNNDFRKGMSLSLVASRDMELMDMLENPNEYAQIQFTWFPYANSWFNPSVRITGGISSTAKRSLLPSGTGTPYIADYMRGIRDDNEYSETAWNTKLIANINLTATCIDLGSWARTYAIAFTDIAMLHNKGEEVKMLYTVGIEGIGIINSHPNYPVRASLGFNTESIKTFMETKNFSDLEYELFFGLYYFY